MAGEMILHSDLNCFYASVEMNENPYLRGKAIAVCGSTEDRHGIVLTASYPAKRMGVKTGAANWQARQCCPGLICVPPHYELYLKYSKLVRRIYARYTDDIEPFGMDENWLAIPYGRGDVEREGRMIAEEIRRSVRNEIGLTVSIGGYGNQPVKFPGKGLAAGGFGAIICRPGHHAQADEHERHDHRRSGQGRSRADSKSPGEEWRHALALCQRRGSFAGHARGICAADQVCGPRHNLRVRSGN